MKFRIFISSVQSEFAEERRMLKAYLTNDTFLREYVDGVYVFEDQSADSRSPSEIYLPRAGSSDIYIGLFGGSYGNVASTDGVSPTEKEYEAATAAHAVQWIFLFDGKGPMDPRMRRLRERAGCEHTWKRISSVPELQREVFASFVDLLREKRILANVPYDASVAVDETMSDLDHERIRWFVRKAIKERKYRIDETASDEEVLRKLGLVSRTDGRLAKAAVLLFGKESRRMCPSCMVKCISCAGTVYERPFVQQVYYGDVFNQIDEAILFVMSHCNRLVGKSNPSTNQTEVEYDIPYDAVKEAIVNAVAHRNYVSNASVEVRLFADRLEVWNPGEMPEGLPTSWLFEEHPSIPFNLLLAEPMFLTRYIERSGSGFGMMVQACREMHLNDPTCEVRNRFFITTIPRKTVMSATPSNTASPKEASRATLQRPQSWPLSWPQSWPQSMDNKILSLLFFGEMSRSEICAKVGVTPKTNSLRLSLARLMEDGLIVYTIPKVPKSRLQKYRLTQHGRAILGKLP